MQETQAHLSLSGSTSGMCMKCADTFPCPLRLIASHQRVNALWIWVGMTSCRRRGTAVSVIAWISVLMYCCSSSSFPSWYQCRSGFGLPVTVKRDAPVLVPHGWYKRTIVGGDWAGEEEGGRGTREKERWEERKCNYRMYRRSKQEECGKKSL